MIGSSNDCTRISNFEYLCLEHHSRQRSLTCKTYTPSICLLARYSNETNLVCLITFTRWKVKIAFLNENYSLILHYLFFSTVELMNFLPKSSPFARKLFCSIVLQRLEPINHQIRFSSQSVCEKSIMQFHLTSSVHRRKRQLIKFNNLNIVSLYPMEISPMNNVNSTKNRVSLSFLN